MHLLSLHWAKNNNGLREGFSKRKNQHLAVTLFLISRTRIYWSWRLWDTCWLLMCGSSARSLSGIDLYHAERWKLLLIVDNCWCPRLHHVTLLTVSTYTNYSTPRLHHVALLLILITIDLPWVSNIKFILEAIFSWMAHLDLKWVKLSNSITNTYIATYLMRIYWSVATGGDVQRMYWSLSCHPSQLEHTPAEHWLF